MLTLENLRRAGCRRIAAILAESGSQIDDDARSGAVFAFSGRYAEEGVRTAIRTEQTVAKISAETLRWLREENPDGVLLFHAHMAIPLREAGYRLPDDFLCAAILAMPQYLPDVAGCDVRSADYARLELRTLLDMVGSGERGFSDAPIQHVLDPVWHPGPTCPVPEPMAFLL